MEEEFIAVYIDDILVFSPDEQTHVKHIQMMIEICKKKLHFQIDFLGSTIGHGEISVQPGDEESDAIYSTALQVFHHLDPTAEWIFHSVEHNPFAPKFEDKYYRPQ